MPKQTNNSSNNAALKGFALTLVILILAVCVMAAMTEGFSNWNPYGWFDKPAEEQQTPEGDDPAPEQQTEDPAPIEATISNSEHIALAMSAAVTAADGEYVEQTLTATVTPSTAEELGVDWTAEWADGSDSSDLSDYLTITPASDGSNICYVRAYAAFDKDIIITVTTRDGGYTATCTVSFVGKPATMNIYVKEGAGTAIDKPEADKENDAYLLSTNGWYSFIPVFENIFGVVDEAAEVSASDWEWGFTGTLRVAVNYSGQGSSIEINATNGVIPRYATDTEQTAGLDQSEIIGYINLIETISIFEQVSSDNYNYSRINPTLLANADIYEDAYHIEVLEADGYITLTARCSEYNLTDTIKIKVVSTVDGVSLDLPSIVF